MITLRENISLKKYNTFGIVSIARYFSVFSTQDQLGDLLDQAARVSAPLFVLGGGSNILLTGNIDGLVMHNEINGIALVDEDEHYVYVTAGAGESWHGFVQY